MKIDVLKVNVLRKLTIFSKSYLQIIVFDKQQVKWLQTRKGKYQEKILNSLEEVALSWSPNNPANICWSSTHLQRNIFTSSKTSWRRLEDVFRASRKTSWKMKNCYAEDVFQTSWRHALKMSSRHILKTPLRRLRGKQNFYWWYLYLTNLNVYLTNLCFTNYIWEI